MQNSRVHGKQLPFAVEQERHCPDRNGVIVRCVGEPTITIQKGKGKVIMKARRGRRPHGRARGTKVWGEMVQKML